MYNQPRYDTQERQPFFADQRSMRPQVEGTVSREMEKAMAIASGRNANDDAWQAVYNVPPGTWEYKAALNDSWDENYGAGGLPGGANIPLTLAADGDVKFYYDHKSH